MHAFPVPTITTFYEIKVAFAAIDLLIAELFYHFNSGTD